MGALAAMEHQLGSRTPIQEKFNILQQGPVSSDRPSGPMTHMLCVGWIPEILGFSTWYVSNDTKISIIPWETDTEKSFSNFCVGVWVGGQSGANFFSSLKDAQFDCASFDTSIVTEERWGVIVLFEKLLEKTILRGLKLRGFDWNPINHNKKLSQKVEYKKSNTMVVLIFKFTHAYSYSPRNFKIRLKFPKSNSHRIWPKFLYPRNQQNPLIHFWYCCQKKLTAQKS